MALTRINNQALTNLTFEKARLPAGSVLQVVNATNATTVNQKGQTSTYADGVSVSITPTSSSSKILVQGSMDTVLYATQRVDMTLRLLRNVDSTDTTLETKTLHNLHGSGTYYPYESDNVPFFWLDSPATTSEITYKVQFRQGSSSGTVYSCHANTLGTSIVTVMEIAG